MGYSRILVVIGNIREESIRICGDKIANDAGKPRSVNDVYYITWSPVYQDDVSWLYRGSGHDRCRRCRQKFRFRFPPSHAGVEGTVRVCGDRFSMRSTAARTRLRLSFVTRQSYARDDVFCARRRTRAVYSLFLRV